MKQTAVEWLVNELENHHVFQDIKNTVAFQQAKAMEKEQIIESYCQGALDISNDELIFPRETSEEYYKQITK